MQVYNGGEVIMPNPYNDGDTAIETLTKMHVSYLNSQYDGTVLQKWKEQKTDKTESVFEQIDAVWGIVWFYPLSKRQIKTVPNL